VQEYFDSSVNTPQQAWHAVGLNTFGVVPDLNLLNRRLLSWNRAAIPLLQRLIPPQLRAPQSASKELIVSHHPLSIISESYRTIRTAILFSQAEKPPQVLLLTSPSQGEGKTITTLNLAIALAEEGYRILVIDADLRKGSCHRRLGIKNHRGLSNILSGNLSLEEGVQATSISGLSLLSRGIVAPNPSALLGSARMRQILSDLRPSFDFILIDSPPAVAVTDASVISVICDGVLLVLHAQKTTTAYARQALERLDAVRAPVLGVVLNSIDLRNPDYAYYHQYYGSAYGSGHNPENGTGRIIEADGQEEPPADEPWVQNQRGNNAVDHAPGPFAPDKFFVDVRKALVEAIGPMAHIVLNEHIESMGASSDHFPQDKLDSLINSVSQEISNASVRERFCLYMSDKIRTSTDA
jgi:capsular exopolysaccharide synthesis family protein